jgi:hypothetical protein
VTPPKSPSQPSTGRPPNPYKPVTCVEDWDALCKALKVYGKAWETWGNDVLSELDALKQRQTGGGGTGNPPTDATQPPKPPFK